MSVREIAVLERMIRPDIADIPPRRLIFSSLWIFPEATMERASMNSLPEPRTAALTAEDREELGDYIHLSDFLALIQSKSRRGSA